MIADRFLSIFARRHHWLEPLLLLAAAFLIRLVYLNQMQSIPTFDFPVMDEKYHVELAEQINDTGYGDEPFYRAPLYPYLLAMFFRITDSSPYWSRFIQIVFGSLLPLLIYLFGLKLFDRRVAFWAATIGVLYPTFIYYDATLLITSTMVILTALLLWQLYRLQDKPTLPGFIVAGLLLGLAGLARPNILLLGPALFLWIWLIIKSAVGWRRALMGYVAMGLACLVVILPVTVRNYVASDDFVLIAWQGGFNFYLGNNRQASGWSATATGIDATWEGGYKEAIGFAEQNEGRTLKRSEVSDFWYDVAWNEIAADPAHFIGLTFRKLRMFINGYEIPNNQNIYLAREYAGVIRPLLFAGLVYFPFGLLAPLAIMGLVLSLGQWRRFLLIYLAMASYIISLLLFFVCARYRQPLLPFMILFGVYAVYRLASYIKQRDGKNLALFLVIFALLAVEANHNILGLSSARIKAEDHSMLGNSYLEQNKLAFAENNFREAVRADSTYADGFNNLGMIQARRGKLSQAAGYFLKALQLDPTSVETAVNLATVYLEGNDFENAIRVLERARVLHPVNDYVHLKLAMTYYEAGQLDEAMTSCQQAIRLNPDNTTARDVYNQLLQAKAADNP